MKQIKINTKNDFTTKGNQRKSGLEQFYTRPEVAQFCVAKFKEALGDYSGVILEPCAGTGEFTKAIVKDFPGTTIDEMDIDPRRYGIRQADFLKADIAYTCKFSIIANPPFGRGNSLSTRFFNHGASFKPEYIGFLIPSSWRKWSLQNRLDNNYHLVSDNDLPDGQSFYELIDNKVTIQDKPSTLKCVFQIWKRKDELRDKITVVDNGYIVKSKPADADFQLITQGWSCGKVNREFDKTKKVNGSRYFTASPKVIDVLESLDFTQFTKNTAYVKSISFAEINYLLNRNGKLNDSDRDNNNVNE